MQIILEKYVFNLICLYLKIQVQESTSVRLRLELILNA